MDVIPHNAEEKTRKEAEQQGTGHGSVRPDSKHVCRINGPTNISRVLRHAVVWRRKRVSLASFFALPFA